MTASAQDEVVLQVGALQAQLCMATCVPHPQQPGTPPLLRTPAGPPPTP